jgi:hypothetical protein
MKINEMIQRVLSLYSQGVASDDSRLSKRFVYSKLLSARALLLSQKLDKRQPISQWAYQTLDCVELVKALPYECPCLPAVGCKILRTKEPLPQPLTGLLNGHEIQSVTSLEGSLHFPETTWEAKKHKKGNKYTAAKPDFYIRNNYLYITTKKAPSVISITGLFDDPLEVDAFPSICGSTPCIESAGVSGAANRGVDDTSNTVGPNDGCPDCESPLDKDLPIEKSMIKTVIELAVQELSVFAAGREDVSNNSRDDGGMQQQQQQ